MKRIIILLLCFATVAIPSCVSTDAASLEEKKDAPAPSDPTVKVLSSNVLSIYNLDCLCNSDVYKNIVTTTVVGSDTFVTFQRYGNEGGLTVIKTSK